MLDIILIHLYLHILVSCSAYSLGVDRKAGETSVMHERRDACDGRVMRLDGEMPDAV
jgi:hypothetical protein